LISGTGTLEVDRRRSARGSAVADERARIAQDLHDSVGQVVAGLGMQLTAWLDDAPDEVWHARLVRLQELADRASRELRDSIEGLLFAEGARLALEPRLRSLVAQFEATTGLPTTVIVCGRPLPMGPAKEDALLRAAREALVNVERHARACRVWVRLVYREREAVLSVRDDGMGLADGGLGRPGHFGIIAMQRRVEDVGGELRVSDSPWGGVVVEAVVPGRKRTPHGTRSGGGRR
jgi:signal transduction histidine kinase